MRLKPSRLITINILLLFSLWAAAAGFEPKPGPQIALPEQSPIKVLASVYGTLGYYSTTIRSQSMSGYVTISNAWLDYYTLGVSSLWLAEKDSGESYYNQQLIAAQASWLIGYRWDVSFHYAFLREGAIIQQYSGANYHFAGGGVKYWFSSSALAGGSFTLGGTTSGLEGSAFRGMGSFHVTDGIWFTSTVIVSKAKWTPRLAVFRQSIILPIGDQSSIIATVDVGRKAFYFDNDLLVAYNQRPIQTGLYQLKAAIKVLDNVFLLPSVEHDTFDQSGVFEGYKSTYGSLGVRVVM